VDYEGVITVGFTNEPSKIPLGIYRRFKYVDIVGELQQEERSDLLRHFLTKGLPLSRGFRNQMWTEWGTALDGATGDVIGKIADDIHYEFMRKYINEHPKDARRLNSLIRRKTTSTTATKKTDDAVLAEVKRIISPNMTVDPVWVGRAIKQKLEEPIVVEQISTAKRVYAEAKDVLANLHRRSDAATGSMQSQPTTRQKMRKIIH